MPEAFSPIVAIVRRELIGSLRQPRYFALMAVSFLIAASVVFPIWPTGFQPPSAELRQIAAALFGSYTSAIALVAMITVPALSGASVASEREEETLELLAMTRAHASHVVIGKVINSVSHFLLLMVAIAPVAATTYFLLGIGITVLLRTMLVMTATAVACTTAGVLCSCVIQRPPVAVVASYIAAATLIGFPWKYLTAILARISGWKLLDKVLSIDHYFVPIASFSVAKQFRFSGAQREYSAEICSALLLLITLFLFLCAQRLVRERWATSRVIASKGTKRYTIQWGNRAGRVAHTLPDGANPVFQKEVEYELSLRGQMGLYLFVLPLAASLVATAILWVWARWQTVYAAYDGLRTWFLIAAVVLPVSFAALTANLFTKEFARETLDSLRCSLLTTTPIVTGKLLASLYAAVIMTSAFLLGQVPFMLTFFDIWLAEDRRIVLLGYSLIAEFMVLAWAATALSSVLSRRVTMSLVIAGALLCSFLGGARFLARLSLDYSPQLYYLADEMDALSPIHAYLRLSTAPSYAQQLASSIWVLSVVGHLSLALLMVCVPYIWFRLVRMRDR